MLDGVFYLGCEERLSLNTGLMRRSVYRRCGGGAM